MFFSSGIPTFLATVSALAPTYTVDTRISGGAISGYMPLGIVNTETKPANAITMAITTAKRGLSIKNLENIFLLSYFYFSKTPTLIGELF